MAGLDDGVVLTAEALERARLDAAAEALLGEDEGDVEEVGRTSDVLPDGLEWVAAPDEDATEFDDARPLPREGLAAVSPTAKGQGEGVRSDAGAEGAAGTAGGRAGATDHVDLDHEAEFDDDEEEEDEDEDDEGDEDVDDEDDGRGGIEEGAEEQEEGVGEEEGDVEGGGAERLVALPPADRERALRAKEEGNRLFGAGDYEGALAQYSEAIEFAPRDGADGEAFRKSLAVFFANRAACLLHLGRFEETIDDCDAALDLDETYVKAMLRRATALEKLEKFDDALQDYEDTLKLDPRNPQVRAAKAALETRVRERDEKLKDEMLGKLKDMGNSLLGKFGLSLDNFKMEKDPKTGGYSVQFQQGGGGGGSGGSGGSGGGGEGR